MKKLLSLVLALTLCVCLSVSAFAEETTEARVPVTLTVVNTVAPISCTVPACLPVSLVDGYVVCANNAAIQNTGKSGSIRVSKVEVLDGAFAVGNFESFSATGESIALSINGCGTKAAGALDLNGEAFPNIAAGASLPVRYKAKVSASKPVTNAVAATVIFTISSVQGD